jgi:hypothetical protein
MKKDKIALIYSESIKYLENFLQPYINVYNEPEDLFILGLLLSVIEYIEDLMIIIENNRKISIPLIARCLFEISVDLMWIKHDRNNLKRLSLESTIGELRSIDAAIKHTQLPEEGVIYLENRKKELESGKNELTRNKIKIVTIREKCLEIGLLKSYEFDYSILCKDIHNNLEAIENRHITKTKNGFGLVYDRDFELENYKLIFAFTISSICRIIECFEKMLNLDFENYKNIDKMAVDMFNSTN